MDATRLHDRYAVVLRPAPDDDPDDLEDAVHDEVLRGKQPDEPRSRVRVVVLDLGQVPDAPRWLRAAGPELPDVTLRVALGEQGFAVARLLGLPAIYEWYPTVELALRGGV